MPPPKLLLELRVPPNERLGAENERVGADRLGAENERLGVERSKLPRFMLRVEPPKKLLLCGRVTVVRVLLCGMEPKLRLPPNDLVLWFWFCELLPKLLFDLAPLPNVPPFWLCILPL